MRQSPAAGPSCPAAFPRTTSHLADPAIGPSRDSGIDSGIDPGGRPSIHAAARRQGCPAVASSGGVAARVAALRAGGMSATAIRRALGLSEGDALACGLVAPRRARPTRGAARAGGPDSRGPSLMAVADTVARACQLPRAQLFGTAQDRRSARARHLCMYLLRELCAGASYPTIGFFLKRDHTTVIYGVRRIAQELERDAALRALHERLRRELAASR